MRKFKIHQATFLLNVLGFIGSLVFYYTVLASINQPIFEEEVLRRFDQIEQLLITS